MKKLLYELIINNNVQILQGDIDWYALLTCAISEKAESYLFSIFLHNNLLTNIPKPIRKVLYISYQYNQKKNTHYIREFQNIRQLLSKYGIFIFPCKGLFLINDIYRDYGIRYMEDMDIISSETNFYTLKELLKRLNFQLVLINDADKSLYMPEMPIFSCLFSKNYPASSLVPFVKLDISFGSIMLKDYKIPLYSDNNLPPEYNFFILCKSLFDDAYKKSKHPNPDDCTLMKLVDINCFIQKYPLKAEYILNDRHFAKTEFIKYTRQCLEYFSKGE